MPNLGEHYSRRDCDEEIKLLNKLRYNEMGVLYNM